MEVSDGDFEDDNGAVKLDGPCNVVLDNVLFVNNSGGAMSLKGDANVHAKYCQFEGNSREKFGGAVLMTNAVDLTIENCTFLRNFAGSSKSSFSPNGNGGAIFIRVSRQLCLFLFLIASLYFILSFDSLQ